MTDPSYAELVATVADLRDQLDAVTAERNQLQAERESLKREIDQTELERSMKRRREYISRGWG